jgi:ABC-type multidrug transport system ATPase subunit
MGDAIVTRELSRYFGNRPALIDVSLRIPKECIFCVAGPNGSGKTTLLNILAGVLSPSKGEFEVGSGLRIGYAYQHPKLCDELTIGENLSFFSQLGGGEREWCENLIEMMKLKGFLEENAGELSSGTRKRVEVAVSLLHNPDIIFMDEPTAGLDIESTKEVLELIKFFKKRGKTAVIATHQLEEFGGVCEMLAVLSRGRIALERDVRRVSGKRLMQIYASALGKG